MGDISRREATFAKIDGVLKSQMFYSDNGADCRYSQNFSRVPGLSMQSDMQCDLGSEFLYSCTRILKVQCKFNGLVAHHKLVRDVIKSTMYIKTYVLITFPGNANF